MAAVAAAIALSDGEDGDTPEVVAGGLAAFNDAAAGPRDRRPLTLSVRRAGEAAVAGGLVGRTSFRWLSVLSLYLPADLRGRGLGAELLRRAEAEARARGCVGAHLDTYGFQARGFYEKQGYAVFGAIPDFPPGHARFFLSKRLDAPPSPPA